MTILEAIHSNTRYCLRREISRGGMGCVYEAEQHGVEGFVKRVAIKTIQDKHLDNPDFVSRFISEAKLVANLVHPNIVQIYQLDEFDGGYYIAMEYINGITCSELLSLHRSLGVSTPIDYITFIISRIARGLEYAHNFKGENNELLEIVHRDVCPKNIMVTSEGEGKLTDFGIAKARNYASGKEGELLLGKVQYMSPEQAMLQKTDSRSDIFSLGVVYYELLTGISPFKSESSIASLSKVRLCKIPPIEHYRNDLPQNLLDILYRMLAKEPNDRYLDTGELCTDLEKMMYSSGYGPTIKKLSQYLYTVFPDFESKTKITPLNATKNVSKNTGKDNTTHCFLSEANSTAKTFSQMNNALIIEDNEE